MPPRAAPFDAVGLITLLTVSASLLVFDAPVLWSVGIEFSIFDVSSGSPPVFAASGGPALSVPISYWADNVPAIGDPWAMLPPPLWLTPVAPASGFANAAGLVVA